MLEDLIRIYSPAGTRKEYYSRLGYHYSGSEIKLLFSPIASVRALFDKTDVLIFDHHHFRRSLSYSIGEDFFRGQITEKLAKTYINLKIANTVKSGIFCQYKPLTFSNPDCDYYLVNCKESNFKIVSKKSRTCISEIDGLYQYIAHFNKESTPEIFALEVKSSSISLKPEHVLENVIAPLSQIFNTENIYYILSAPFRKVFVNNHLNPAVKGCYDFLKNFNIKMLVVPLGVNCRDLYKVSRLVCSGFYIWKHNKDILNRLLK